MLIPVYLQSGGKSNPVAAPDAPLRDFLFAAGERAGLHLTRCHFVHLIDLVPVLFAYHPPLQLHRRRELG